VWRPGPDGDPAAERTAEVLDRGLLVAGPSDTVYGLLARADSDAAWDRLRAVKGREGKFLALVRDVEQAREVAAVSGDVADRLDRVWPGPVTVILPTSGAWSDRFGATVALRSPRDDYLQGVLRRVGAPLLSTSANLPGEPPPVSANGLAPVLPHVALVVDGGPAAAALPSTIVDLTGRLPRLVRAGSGDARPLLDPGGPPL